MAQKHNKKTGFTFVDKLGVKLESLYKRYRLLFIVVTSLAIVVWQWPLILSTDGLLSGDFDYFTQAYEAIRTTILQYHQFPWVNAWIGGGVPLYGNPQVGVISIQTLLVLLFGAPFGLKLSVIVYSLIGFWGMFYLLKHNFKVKPLLALPLASIWITNGFFVAHLVSHYSFSMFMVVPLLLYLLLNISKKRYWLYFGVALGLFMLSAFHYAAFHGLLILAGCALFLLIRNRQHFKRYLVLYLKALAVFLLIAGHRILHTLQFAVDFPRAFSDPPDPLIIALKSFIVPIAVNFNWFYDDLIPQGVVPYGWGERSVFIGYLVSFVIVSLLALCFVLAGKYLYAARGSFEALLKKTRPLRLPLGLALLFVLFIVISLGNFGPLSPYGLLQHLPAFSGMRVSSRWLIWAVLFGLIFVGVMIQLVRNDRARQVLTLLVLLGAAEVYIVGMANDQFFYKPIDYRSSNAAFEQFEDFDRYNLPRDLAHYKTRPTYDRRFEIYSYEATLNNFGQARGYEPIVDTYYQPTARCGIVQGCPFVKSGNAKVAFWSPNKIVLQRTGKGPIELNMNPSNYWRANGQALFPTARTVEVLQPFVIASESEEITLTVEPPGISRLVRVAGNRLGEYY